MELRDRVRANGPGVAPSSSKQRCRRNCHGGQGSCGNTLFLAQITIGPWCVLVHLLSLA